MEQDRRRSDADSASIGAEIDAMRGGNFTVVLLADCRNVVNPIADVGQVAAA
jgi:hypothetical protein